jgi:hypothetical protein
VNNFFLPFTIATSDQKISHNMALTFLGSCFSDEIGSEAILSGFDVLMNPFGTIFNPISLSRQIVDAIKNSEEFPLLERDSRFYSWDASTKLVGDSPVEIRELLLMKREQLRLQLSKPGLLLVTFGTSFIYRLEQSQVVANCHKQPHHLFRKELAAKDELVNDWIEAINLLRQFNPFVNIVFTVSPVRHIRDGIIENTISKARLFEVVSELTSKHAVGYFPSFEIILDELRDYRFFKQDRIHPNEEAVSYVWKRFSDVYFTEDTQEIIYKIKQIRKRLSHKSDIQLLLDDKTNQFVTEIEQNYPWIQW